MSEFAILKAALIFVWSRIVARRKRQIALCDLACNPGFVLVFRL